VVGNRRPFGDRAARVARAADALQERGEPARRAELAHELDRADVDAELERCGRDERGELAVAQAPLDALAAVDGEAAVVRGHAVAARAARRAGARCARPGGACSRTRAWCGARDLARDLGDDLAPLLHRRDTAESSLPGTQIREIERAAVARVDDLAARAAVGQARVGTSPTSSRAIRSIGRCVAESRSAPGRSQSASSRSSESARCEPRLSRAVAWISSTITVRAPRSVSRLRSASA
jgi:hypothetical protein